MKMQRRRLVCDGTLQAHAVCGRPCSTRFAQAGEIDSGLLQIFRERGPRGRAARHRFRFSCTITMAVNFDIGLLREPIERRVAPHLRRTHRSAYGRDARNRQLPKETIVIPPISRRGALRARPGIAAASKLFAQSKRQLPVMLKKGTDHSVPRRKCLIFGLLFGVDRAVCPLFQQAPSDNRTPRRHSDFHLSGALPACRCRDRCTRRRRYRHCCCYPPYRPMVFPSGDLGR